MNKLMLYVVLALALTTAVAAEEVTVSVKEFYPQGLDYVFACSANGFTPTSFDWYFGDAQKQIDSANMDVFHTYSAGGTYQVFCTASDGFTTSSDELTVFAGGGFIPPPADPDAECVDSVVDMPETCNDGVIVADVLVGGCRQIVCRSDFDPDASMIQVLACDKPDEEEPEFFEMYRQVAVPSPFDPVPEVCLGDLCMRDQGFLRSEDFPICFDGVVPPEGFCGDGVVNQPSEECDSTAPIGFTCSAECELVPVPPDGECFESVCPIPATCEGGNITFDDCRFTPEGPANDCRNIVCESANSSLYTIACEKPDEGEKEFFEIYKISETGLGNLEICIGDTCVDSIGFAQSYPYPICIDGVEQ